MRNPVLSPMAARLQPAYRLFFIDQVTAAGGPRLVANPGEGSRLLVLCFPLDGTIERLIERSSGLFVFWL